MVGPRSAVAAVLFYRGRLDKGNRQPTATESRTPPLSGGDLMNIARLSSLSPRTSRGTYTATVEYSTATEADLRNAGTSYADWLKSYTILPDATYRSPGVLSAIHNLAIQVVRDAGAQTPYDAATAIEAYLPSDKFAYTLTPPRPTGGEDPLAYFLFTSHKGYCEFFATAMGDMLRSLGIPGRLVSGFGPGQYDTATNDYVVHSADAHTSVAAYFPKYGWIQFEPTNCSFSAPMPRSATGSNICLRD